MMVSQAMSWPPQVVSEFTWYFKKSLIKAILVGGLSPYKICPPSENSLNSMVTDMISKYISRGTTNTPFLHSDCYCSMNSQSMSLLPELITATKKSIMKFTCPCTEGIALKYLLYLSNYLISQ